MPTRRLPVAGLIVLIASAALLLSGCSDTQSIRIFAASSLQDVLPEILDAYAETNDGVTFEVQYGGSQALASQIELGAEVDLFLSANEEQLDRLADAGFITARRELVTNSLVIAVASDSPIERLEDLAEGDRRIALGAPEVPVGELTERLLSTIDPSLADQIRANVITEDPNVRIVLSRVELGEADAAFVYRTDVLTTDDLRAIELPVDLEPNLYIGGVIEGARDESAAVLEFIGGATVEPIWRAAGFEAVPSR